MKENPFYILCSGLLLVVLAHMFPLQTQSASDPHVSSAQTQAEKSSIRSLEKIDQWNLHTFGGSGVYLFRVMTCYYVVAFGDNSVAVTHLESCPSPDHRRPLPTGVNNQVHPGDPVIGRPLGDTEFSGVILEDEVKRRKQ